MPPTAVLACFAAAGRLSAVRREQYQGKEWLVVPAIALVSGVTNGELVTDEVLESFPGAWNDVPVVMGHPKKGGVAVSARTQDQVFEAPGRFWNVHVEQGKLKGEIWLDIAKVEAMGGDALQAMTLLESGGRADLSTGYWRNVKEKSGMYKGQYYKTEASDLRPDHLAILLYEKAACSWLDGCGAPRLNQEENDMSMQERIRTRFQQLVDRFIPLLKQSFEMGVSIQAEPFSINSSVINDQEDTVKEKDRVIAAILACNACKFTKKQLEPMDLETLKTLQAMGQTIVTNEAETNQAAEQADQEAAGQADQDPDDDDKEDVEDQAAGQEGAGQEPDQAPAGNVALPREVTEMVELVKGLGGIGKVKEALAMATNTINAGRAEIITRLVANERCAFDKAELDAMPLATLTKLDESLQPADYGGLFMPTINVRAGEDEIDRSVPVEPPIILNAAATKRTGRRKRETA